MLAMNQKKCEIAVKYVCGATLLSALPSSLIFNHFYIIPLSIVGIAATLCFGRAVTEDLTEDLPQERQPLLFIDHSRMRRPSIKEEKVNVPDMKR